ncbi:MAG: alpha/beta hydrolase [Thermoguttaceae bacterium]
MSEIKKIDQYLLGNNQERRGEMLRKEVKPYPSEKSRTKPSAMPRKRSEYLLFSPIHYEPKHSYPLLIWFHSPGADEKELFRVMPQISLRNYVAVAPRGLTAEENGNRREDRFKSVEGCVSRFAPLYDWAENASSFDTVETRVFEAIGRARLSCNLAPGRVFLAGIGAGGSMALRVGARYPETFAGVISFSGKFPLTPCSLIKWNSLRRLPMMMMLGSKNPVFSQSTVSEQLRLFHTAGMSVSIRQYKTSEDAVPQMFKDANLWMMDHILNPTC